VLTVMEKRGISERRACRAIGQARSSQRYVVVKRIDEDEVRAEIIELATLYGRYGYQTICDIMRNKGRKINPKRVERIWREEGLKVPRKQPKRRRLWLNDGSCVRLRPEYRNHVWSYDFIEDKLTNGRKVRWLNIIDEHERLCLASVPRFKWRYSDIIEVLSGIMVTRGCPEYIRSDNGSEFTAKRLLKWFKDIEVTTMFIEPGSPWENGYCESFNSIMRDNFLNGELFDTLLEAKVLTERWKHHYNTVRPHGSLGGRPPAPQAVIAA
jgi:putative transposase